MDGAVGLIRVAFDFSVWPVDGRKQNSAGSSNIFTSADACQGSTCIPWYETMTAEDVITAVVYHVLNNVANSDSATAAPKLRKEWSKVLRLALVVDHHKGAASHSLASALSPARRLVNHSTVSESLRGTASTVSAAAASVSSLVVLNPTTRLMQQPNVIQSVTTSGTIRTLETAVVVLPYDDDAQKKASAQQELQDDKRRKLLVVKASSDDLNRKFQAIRNRDDNVRRHSDKMRSAFNGQVLDDDVGALAELVERQKNLRDRKTSLLASVEAEEQQWRRDLVTVEQSLSRLEGRVRLYQGEKDEIEQLIQDVHSSAVNSSTANSQSPSGGGERSYYY